MNCRPYATHDKEDERQNKRSRGHHHPTKSKEVIICNFNNSSQQNMVMNNSDSQNINNIVKSSKLHSIDKLNGCIILHETPVVSRLIVKRDVIHQTPTTTSNNANSSDHILATNTKTTTLYKCHLCCSICPTLHRMRCHLSFHCRKDLTFLKSSPSHGRPDDQGGNLPLALSQKTAEELSPGLRSLDKNPKDQRSSTLGMFSSPSSIEAGRGMVADRINISLSPHSKQNSYDMKLQVTNDRQHLDSTNFFSEKSSSSSLNISNQNNIRSTSDESEVSDKSDLENQDSSLCKNATGRKRSFSDQDDYSHKNTLTRKHASGRDESPLQQNSCCGANFSIESKIISNENCPQKKKKELNNNSNHNNNNNNSTALFNLKHPRNNSATDITIKSEPNEQRHNNQNTSTEDDAWFPRNGSTFASPYYWLARQQWLNLTTNSQVPASCRQIEEVRHSGHLPAISSPYLAADNSSSEMKKESTSDVKSHNSLSPPSPHTSLNRPSPVSSPSKSSTPSDDSPSSPHTPAPSQLYNPLELVKIMHNLAAYPNLLPPVYPFFPISPTLPSNPLLDPRYFNKTLENFTNAKHDRLSDTEEAPDTYPSKSSASMVKIAPSFSFDKFLPRTFYPYYSTLPTNYNLPSPKFIPGTDSGAADMSSCVKSFTHSTYCKPFLGGSEANFSCISSKTWTSSSDIKPNSESAGRKETKVTSYCKSDKSDAMKSSAKRGEACRPIKLADGRTVYHCSQCRKTFSNISDVNRHMDFHEDIRPFKCKFCSYYARTNSQLKVHMMRHQGIRQYVCHLCNYKGVTQSDLNRHTKSQIHVLKSRNECSQCSEGFVSPMNLAQHCKSRHHTSVT